MFSAPAAQAVVNGVDNWIAQSVEATGPVYLNDPSLAVDDGSDDSDNIYWSAEVLRLRIGNSWSAVPNAAAPFGINAPVAATGTFHGTILEGTTSGAGNYGVFSSDTLGLIWTAERPSGVPPASGYDYSYNPVAFANDGDNVYAADFYGAIRSRDGGANWTRIWSDPDGLAGAIGGYDITVHQGSIFLTTHNYGVIRSDDEGDSWYLTSLNQGSPAIYTNSYASIGAALYVVSADGKIYKTTDKGNNWTAIQSNLPGFTAASYSIAAIGDALITTNLSDVYYTMDDGGVSIFANWGGSWTALPALPIAPSGGSYSTFRMLTHNSTLYANLAYFDNSSGYTKYDLLSITPKLTPVTPPEKNLGDCPCMNPPIVGAGSGNGGPGGGQSPGTPGGGINAATGNLFQVEVDYAGAAATRLGMVRNYNSLANTNGGPGTTDRPAGIFGVNWWTRYDNRIDAPTGSIRELIRGDGRVETFILAGSSWIPDTDVTTKLLPQLGGGWIAVNADDSQESYDGLGKLTGMTERNGQTTTLTYDMVGRLSTITGPFGHTMTLNYDTSNRVNKVTEPDGVHYSTYSYDANGNLASVTYADGKVRRYQYTNLAYPHALTGIVDENNLRLMSYGYDMKGRATLITGGNNDWKTQVIYRANGTSDVTTPNGAVRTYNFTTALSITKPTTITGAPCTDCGGVGFTYDANGFIASITDSNGNLTNYTHDARGLETARTEAVGTGQQRTITTTWDTAFRLPLTITEPNRATTFTYDGAGNMLTRTVTGGGKTRAWTYTYNGLGQLLTVDGPRTDVSDVTTYVYYPNNGIDPYGMLKSVTNALSHQTQYTVYDANGRVKTALDPNGTSTALTYDLRGRLLTRTTGGLQTAYQYDFAGNLTRLTRPDGSYADFAYDDAHRVNKVTDNLNNSIEYSLNASGQATREVVRDSSGTVTQKRFAAYDDLGRLAKSIGANNQTTSYSYDANDNLVAVTDGLGHVSSLSYDALDRQAGGIDPLLGAAAYGYDANDNLTGVNDPRVNGTGYGYDNLGNRTGQGSPDTGTASMVYDDAGNLTQSTDAAGRVQGYSYDALNRLIQATATGLTNTVYTYDGGTYGKGHLTGMTDPSGTTSWTYDALGRLTALVQTTTGAVARTVSYTYNSLGQLATMTYPSGKVVTYAYNANGQISSLKLNGTNLLTGITYQPFGAAKGWSWGNGTAYARTFDLDGRLLTYPLGSRTRTLVYDAAGRITNYNDTNSTYNQTFGYDSNDRLTGWTGGWGPTEAYTYDANGNRKSYAVTGQSTATYNYPSTSNKLSSISGGSLPFTPTYDATGNLLSIHSGVTFSYDGRNRMATSTGSGILTNYWYNGLGQRVRKTWNGTPAASVLFVYGPDRKHLGSYDLAGALTEETVFLGDTPVAVSTGASTVSYLYADHINAIRVITSTTNQVRWSWEQTNAFGSTLPNQNPSALGTFNYRRGFPGQFYDAEKLSSSNGFRDYLQLTGRYLQSDPLGLEGGVNTYGYVGGSPAMYVDPNGLNAKIIRWMAGVVIENGPSWWESFHTMTNMNDLINSIGKVATSISEAATSRNRDCCKNNEHPTLYRAGNSSGPKLGNIRIGKEILGPDPDIIYPPGGLSSWDSVKPGFGDKWWALPENVPVPPGICLVKDGRGHWTFQPSFPMPTRVYTEVMATTRPLWIPVWE